MPWTKKTYPSAMKNLADVEREKAIEIANRLVEEGYEDERAIPIAISQAKAWYDARGENVSDSITHHLKPKNDRWVIESSKDHHTWTFKTKAEAMEKVKTIAYEEKAKIMIHDEKGKFQKIY